LTYIEKGSTEYIKASLALFFGGFVTFAILYTTQPLLPIFAKEFHVSAASASLTVSVSTGILSFMMLIAAALSDRIGKKKIMVLSMIFTSGLGMIMAFSPNFISLVLLRRVCHLCDFIHDTAAVADFRERISRFRRVRQFNGVRVYRNVSGNDAHSG